MNNAIYKRVVVLGVDGAGSFFANTSTPNIDRIFENGAVTYDALTMIPSISAECWASCLMGVLPKCHQRTNFIADKEPYPTDSLYPSVFRVIREKRPASILASISYWPAVNVGMIEDNLGVHKVSGFEGKIAEKVAETVTDTQTLLYHDTTDCIVAETVCEYIAENDPELLFVHFGSTDSAGHWFEYGKKEHLQQISNIDGYIGKIYDAYQERGFLDDTLFIVTTDHGGVRFSHGGTSDVERRIFFAAKGKTVVKGKVGEMDIRDVAGIILYALGIEQPETWTARVPSGLFEGVVAAERPVYEMTYDEPLRTHNLKETPIDQKVTDIIGDERILAYLPLDDDIQDVTNRTLVRRNGKLYFLDGYYGKGIQFMDGGLSVCGKSVDNQSFSLSLWMKNNGSCEAAPIFSIKTDDGKMLMLSLWLCALRVEICDEETRMDEFWPLPFDYLDGWVHVIFVVDREAGEVRLCYDFGEPLIAKIPDKLLNISFNSFEFSVGDDGTTTYRDGLYAVLDEYVLVDGALTQEDVKKIESYYRA